jgi:hypothetical protein
MEAMKSEFEIFSASPLQNSVVRSFKREFTPLSALQHGAPIEFAVTGTDLLYLDLSKSYLYVRAKITDAGGANIAANVQVAPINLTLHSLFSNVDVEIGGKMISDPNGHYAYRSYLETLLTHDPDVQDSQLQSEIWHKDTAGSFGVFATTGGPAFPWD